MNDEKPDLANYLSRNRQLYLRYQREFCLIFRVPLKKYYGTTGFELVSFDREVIKPPGGSSTYDEIDRRYGSRAVKLVEILIGVEHESTLAIACAICGEMMPKGMLEKHQHMAHPEVMRHYEGVCDSDCPICKLWSFFERCTAGAPSGDKVYVLHPASHVIHEAVVVGLLGDAIVVRTADSPTDRVFHTSFIFERYDDVLAKQHKWSQQR